MQQNRSSPSATIIPVLTYPDVGEASDWLCRVFGFRERLRIGSHRAQLIFGDGAVIVTERQGSERGETPGASELTHSVHVRVEDVDQHHARASEQGARILQPPASHEYGERQYSAEDLGGHRWTFSQSIADVDPASLGFTVGELE